MDPTVVRYIKLAWCVALLVVTGIVLVGWGFWASAAAALAFVGISLLAFIAFILYLLMGDVPVVWRILMIAFFFVGLLIEVGAIVAMIEWVARGVPK
jgi:xanthine/uracil/vitamin C permease (AzgA family)